MQTSDRRWVVITEKGDVHTLGRARDPTDEEVAAAEGHLRAARIEGWIAIQSHSFHAPVPPTFLEVRTLGEPRATFRDAVAALMARVRV